MERKRSPSDAGPVSGPARNFQYLIETFRPHLGIPEGTNQIAKYFHEKSGLSAVTIRALLQDAGRKQPHTHTLSRLAHCFKEVVPDIEARWLSVTDIEAFRALLARGNNQDAVRFNIPGYQTKIADAAHWLCGTYVAYRYGVDAPSDEQIVRQVVHIWLEASTLRFRMSYPRIPLEAPREFSGHALPVGSSVMCIGWSVDRVGQADRACSLFFHDDRSAPVLRNCKHGILTTTRQREDSASSAASIVLVRVDWTPPDLDAFIAEVTCVTRTHDIIRSDFGLDYEVWLRSFFDNRPRGTPKEKDLEEIERAHLHRDPVLRLDRMRFNYMMPNVLERAEHDANIYAPFKESWMRRHGQS